MCFQGKEKANRIFYLSIPPSIFTDVAAAASDAASSTTGWNRVIVEKPFGRDLESYQVTLHVLLDNLLIHSASGNLGLKPTCSESC